MIDSDGFRANVAMILMNRRGKIFWGKRIHQQSWQFPQGGVKRKEAVLAAMYRELFEEVGLLPRDVEVIAVTKYWLKYRLPKRLIRDTRPLCIGQKQKWFLLRLRGPDSTIELGRSEMPEFDGWRWVDYWYPVSHVVDFKRQVYRKALGCFARMAKGRGSHHRHGTEQVKEGNRGA